MEKVFWKIDEVAKLVGENASTLRFWEKEFRHLKPRTNGKKTRFYTQKNIDDIKIIQHLLLLQLFQEKKLNQSRYSSISFLSSSVPSVPIFANP